VDIVVDIVKLAGRVARLLGLDVRTVYMSSVGALATLPTDYDVVMAIGSLHNAPESVMRPEYQELTRRLRSGGPLVAICLSEIPLGARGVAAVRRVGASRRWAGHAVGGMARRSQAVRPARTGSVRDRLLYRVA
jgi:putative intracellular protease/amidase